VDGLLNFAAFVDQSVVMMMPAPWLQSFIRKYPGKVGGSVNVLMTHFCTFSGESDEYRGYLQLLHKRFKVMERFHYSVASHARNTCIQQSGPGSHRKRQC